MDTIDQVHRRDPDITGGLAISCIGSAAYDHHSRRKSTLTVPYFWVRFNMHDINRIIDKINIKINIILYISDVATYAR